MVSKSRRQLAWESRDGTRVVGGRLARERWKKLSIAPQFSQSLNMHMNQPSFAKLTALHFHAWSKVRKYFYLHNGALLKILMDKFR